MNIDRLKKRKKELGLSNAALAELSGVSLGSINKIFAGQSVNPRVETVKAIERALGMKRAEPKAYDTDTESELLQDSAAEYKVLYTVKDVEALPEDKRVELIDGVLYDMAGTTVLHQKIARFIYVKLYAYIEGKGGLCQVFFAPLDVQLDKDEYTLLEPDIFIICDRQKDIKKRIWGAPDWVAEVISPSTKFKDYITKSQKYMNAGVREYWIVDADAGKVTVYSKNGEDFNMEVYPLSVPVPVGIYDDLKLDLSWIEEE